MTPEWNKTNHSQTVFYTEQRCIPLQGQPPVPSRADWILSKGKLVFSFDVTPFGLTGLNQDLEELMVEGLLLQVSLPEVHTLHRLLLDRATSQHTMSPERDESPDCDKRGQFHSQGTKLSQVNASLF